MWVCVCVCAYSMLNVESMFKTLPKDQLCICRPRRYTIHDIN